MANSEWLFCWKNWLPSLNTRLTLFTLLRRKPRLRAEAHYGAQARVFRPWMNAGRVPFEASKERSRVCFGGFRLPARSPAPRGEGRPDEACGGATGFSPWGSTSCSLSLLMTRKGSPGKSGQTFLWMTPGFRIRGSSQLKHFSKYCLKVILLRSW